MKRFLASTIKCYEEDSVLVIALSDTPQGLANFMMMTRLDDDDNATVDEGVGFQTDQSEYEMPAAIEKVILRPESLEVVVKPEFSGFFGGSRVLAEIPQGRADSAEQVGVLKDALQHMFRETQVELVI